MKKKPLFSKALSLFLAAVLMFADILMSSAFAAGVAPPFEAVSTVSGDTATIAIKTSEIMEYSYMEIEIDGSLPAGFVLQTLPLARTPMLSRSLTPQPSTLILAISVSNLMMRTRPKKKTP